MIHTINYVPDVEEILITKLRDYLVNEVKFKDIYKNFGNVRVSGTHPFVYLVESDINGTKLPQGLFPSITVVMESDAKNPEINIATIVKDFEISSTQVADITNNRDLYIISDSDLSALDSLTQNGNTVWARGARQYRRAYLVCEVWSLNPKVKNRLYDLLINFLMGSIRFTIKQIYDIIIIENEISGEKSGNYNFDFGKVIYGGIVRFPVDYAISQYRVDTGDQTTFSSVEHTEKDVHRNE